jgi:prepilin-type N-terminal cleavage/methylation domain-containing protein
MKHTNSSAAGFSLIELILSMTIMLILLSIVSVMISKSMSIRAREGQTTDALAASQAALNVMSREISNSGFGLYDDTSTRNANNGIILTDSNDHRIHFRANLFNTAPYTETMDPGATSDPGEDVTYFFDSATKSIVRYDPNDTPQTSVIVNRISNVTFAYFNYTAGGPPPTASTTTPTVTTGRIEITVEVQLDPVVGQPDRTVRFTSQVNMRNSRFMLSQY